MASGNSLSDYSESEFPSNGDKVVYQYVYDSSSSNRRFRVYVNGTMVSEDSLVDNFLITGAASNRTFSFGKPKTLTGASVGQIWFGPFAAKLLAYKNKRSWIANGIELSPTDISNITSAIDECDTLTDYDDYSSKSLTTGLWNQI